MNCAHPDVRTFHNLRCCLSCGLAVRTTGENAGNNKDTRAETLIDRDIRRLAPRYVFKKLNYVLGQEIRLVLLQPGSYHEDLRCKIIHANLDDYPEFDAISYTWADQDGKIQMKSRVICQDGHGISISNNCDAVLRRIRAWRGRAPLWIDMLCINQTNFTERNHQVGLMDAIYRAAKRVIVDLGDESRSSEAVFDYLASFDPRKRIPSPLLNIFLSRRWFHRVWVLQEALLAKAAVVQCGSRTSTWEDLKALCQQRPFDQDKVSNCRPLPAVLSINSCSDYDLEVDQLVRLLDSIRMIEATDPHDKIYALLGLCEKQLREQLPVDYAEDLCALYTRVAALYVLRKSDASILNYVVGGSSIKSLPSWVPDWTLPKTAAVVPSQHLTSEANLDAAFHSPDLSIIRMNKAKLKLCALTPRFQSEPTPTLRVGGRCLGTIRVLFHHQPSGLYATSKSGKLESHELAWWHQNNLIDDLQDRSDVRAQQQNYGREIDSEDAELDSLEFWSRLEDEGILLPRTMPQHSGYGILPAFGTEDWWFMINYWDCGFCGPHLNSRCLRPSYHSPSMVKLFAKQSKGITSDKLVFGTDISLGYGPRSIQQGDSIWILEGQPSVFILREDTLLQCYRILGVCFYFRPTLGLYQCPLCRIHYTDRFNKSPKWTSIGLI